MFCPECEGEYREGFTRCADCEVDLVAALPTHVDAKHVDARLRRVAELKAARDGRGDRREQEQPDEDECAFHPGQ